jgi:hypothetical protein
MPNGTATLPEEQVREEQRVSRKEPKPGEAIGSIAGGVIAVIAGIFAIVGLAGIYPVSLVSLAAIGLGIAFLLDGAAIVKRLSALLYDATSGKIRIAELGPGTTGETLAGITGVALGILAFLGIVPVVLALCAAIVFGAALVIGSRTKGLLHRVMVTYRQEHQMPRDTVNQVVFGTTILQVLFGLSVFTLAIIGLGNVAPLTLSLVCMLLVAVALVLTNPALVGKVAPALRT